MEFLAAAALFYQISLQTLVRYAKLLYSADTALARESTLCGFQKVNTKRNLLQYKVTLRSFFIELYRFWETYIVRPL